MVYRILVCVSQERIRAFDVAQKEVVESISIEGNAAMDLQNENSIAEFCEYLKSYYNIEKLSDIKLSICIVNIEADKKWINEIYNALRESGAVDIIHIKKVIPLLLMKRRKLAVNVTYKAVGFGCNYYLHVNDAYEIEYVNEAEGDDVNFEWEDLAMLFFFDGKGLLVDEQEQEKLRKEISQKEKQIEEKNHKYLELKKKYNELEKKTNHLLKTIQDELENRKKNSTRRVIWAKQSNFSAYESTMLGFATALGKTNIGISELQLLYRDGEIVKENEEIAAVVINIGIRTSLKTDTSGRIFYLVDEGEKFKEGMPVAIIANMEDTREDAMKWYESVVDSRKK